MLKFSFLYETRRERINRYEDEIGEIVDRMVYLLNHHARPYHIMKNGVFEPGYRWSNSISEIEYGDLSRRLIGVEQSLFNTLESERKYQEAVRDSTLFND